MKENANGFISDGENRLRDAIETRVRRQHEGELESGADYWQLENKIQKEIEEWMERLASPESNWSS